MRVIEPVRTERTILVLNGVGGDANEGRALAVALRRKFSKSFNIIVPPSGVGSALVYSVLISSGIFLSVMTHLSHQ